MIDLKEKINYIGWSLRIDDLLISNLDIENIREALLKVASEEVEFLVVEAPKTIANCNFIQACLDVDDLYHIEVSLKKEEEPGSLLYYRDGYKFEETLKIFKAFVEKGKVVSAKGWDLLGEFE